MKRTTIFFVILTMLLVLTIPSNGVFAATPTPSPTPTPAPTPNLTTTLTPVYPDGATEFYARPCAKLQVKLTDASGVGISGQTIRWTSLINDCEGFPRTSVTDSSGIAQEYYYMFYDAGVDYTTTVTAHFDGNGAYLASSCDMTVDVYSPALPTVTPTRTPTPTPTAVPTSTPDPAYGLKVQFFNANTSASNNTLYTNYKLVNTGSSAITLSDVKMRYYFTIDTAQPLNFACDWSSVSNSNVTSTFCTISKTNADRYCEVGFLSGAGTLAAGANIEVKGRIYKSDWSNFTQTNDYSFDATDTNYVDWTKVTGYLTGGLKWGIEP